MSTPAKQAGIEVGTKVVMDGEHFGFDMGEVLTLTDDDGSDCPRFENDSGRSHYAWLSDVTIYKSPEPKLIPVGERVEVGDVLILKDGKGTRIVDNAGEPDSDNDYETEDEYVNVSRVEAIYRPAKETPKPGEEKVTVTLEVSKAAALRLNTTGGLLEAEEVSRDYSDEFRDAVAEVINAMRGSYEA